MFSFSDIKSSVDQKGFFVCRWDEIVESASFDVITSDGLEELSGCIQALGLDVYPKIVESSNGFSVANRQKSLLGETLVFHRPHPFLDKKRPEIAKGMVTAHIAVAMAKADGVIEDEEVASLQAVIEAQSYLSHSEQYAIFIAGLQLMQRKVMRETILDKYSNLDDSLKKVVLTIAKDVAVADGRVAKQERNVLAELYRISDIPTNTVSKDLLEHAKMTGVELELRRAAPTVSDITIDEIDDIGCLDSLLEEFEEF
ncbi:conserved hypothetical protein [Vibrio chagasii]|nr:conserved hypothetical protein [Vibrio chagasii]